MSEEDYDFEAIAHARYEVDCECGDVISLEHDPAGEIVHCENCGAHIAVRETI